jgi:cell shape-determining protein MreC
MLSAGFTLIIILIFLFYFNISGGRWSQTQDILNTLLAYNEQIIRLPGWHIKKVLDSIPSAATNLKIKRNNKNKKSVSIMTTNHLRQN